MERYADSRFLDFGVSLEWIEVTFFLRMANQPEPFHVRGTRERVLRLTLLLHDCKMPLFEGNTAFFRAPQKKNGVIYRFFFATPLGPPRLVHPG